MRVWHGSVESGSRWMLDVADPERVILTTGASHALNLAIHGTRRLRRVDVIASCADHVAVLMPLYRLQQAKRIHLCIIGLDATGQIDVAGFNAALDRAVRLVVLPHSSHVTGQIFDVEPLFALAKSVGAETLLNAAQTIGEVPVNPADLKADMVAISGHKRLRGQREREHWTSLLISLSLPAVCAATEFAFDGGPRLSLCQQTMEQPRRSPARRT